MPADTGGKPQRRGPCAMTPRLSIVWFRQDLRLQDNPALFSAVDAGMRERLDAQRWMHNRVRMVVASFLVKHLLIPWQRGAEWFWDTLVDAGLVNNTLGWQWTAGCGSDAAHLLSHLQRPVLQGDKFDLHGHYV